MRHDLADPYHGPAALPAFRAAAEADLWIVDPARSRSNGRAVAPVERWDVSRSVDGQRVVHEYTVTNKSYFRATFTAALGFYAARAIGLVMWAVALWCSVALWSLSRQPGGLEAWAGRMIGG